jgi:hypothetical protein
MTCILTIITSGAVVGGLLRNNLEELIMESEQFQALLKEIARKHKSAAKASRVLTALTDLRREHCPHTDLEFHENYNGGGYDYTNYTDYWSVCKCCGQRSETVRKSHGSYA